MLVFQARDSRSGSAGWPIACVGLPPGSGQSGLTAGRRQRDRRGGQVRVGLEPAAEPEHRNPLARAAAASCP